MYIYRNHWKPIGRLQEALRPVRRSALRRFSAWTTIGLMWMTPLSAASLLQPHDSIRLAAKTYLENNPPVGEGRIEFTIGHLDSRLRLQQCAAALEVFRPPGGRNSGHTTLGVRCSGPKPWKLYIPVAIKVYRPVAVAQGALLRGALLTAADIELVEKDVSRLGYGFIADPSNAVGKELRRSVTAGTVMTPHHLAAPHIVERGQTVVIVANSGGIEVRMAGEALADGAHNDRIRVRNNKTRRIVEGTVSAPGVVQVLM